MKPPTPVQKALRGPLVYVMLILGALWLFYAFASREPQPNNLTLPELEQKVVAGQVAEAKILEGTQVVQGTLTNDDTFETTYPSEYQDDLVTLFLQNDVPFDIDPQKGGSILGFILNLLPFILLIALVVFFYSQTQGGGNKVMSFGRSKAKLVTKEQPKTARCR